MGHDIEYIKNDDMDTENFILHPVTVMLNYAGEYCDACQAAVTVIRNSNAALKSCVEQLLGANLLQCCMTTDSAALF